MVEGKAQWQRGEVDGMWREKARRKRWLGREKK
jgi:hypothetical protein